MKNPFSIISSGINSVKCVVHVVGKENIKKFVKDEASEKGKKVLEYLHVSLKDYNNENCKNALIEIRNNDFSDEQLEEISINHENSFVREAAKKELAKRKEN